MSEAPKDDLESAIQFFEKNVLGRALSAEERVKFKMAQPKIDKEMAALRELTMSPIEKRLRLVAFKKRLKMRQGTITPDFEVLYKMKAALDRKLSEP